MTTQLLLILTASGIITVFTSCKKFIEIEEPETQLTTQTVFRSDLAANAAVAGIYTNFNNALAINSNLTPYLGLYTDELTGTALNSSALEFYNGLLTSGNTNVLNCWKAFYFMIYQANAVLEGLSTSTGLTASARQQFEGEAKFLRAFAYFYLVNLFGDVPLLTSTDVYTNAVAGRTMAAQVYDQIIADLNGAKSSLSDTYADAERVRATAWAASALLARVHLYRAGWAQAITEAGAVIDSGLFPLTNTNNVFMTNSQETILQAWTPEGFTTQGLLLNAATAPIYLLTNQLLDALDPGDDRLKYWTRSVTSGPPNDRVSYKYKQHAPTAGPTAEYLVIFRSAEQYLVRAEARAELDDLQGAVDDLNVIRSRSGLAWLSSNISKDSCLLLVQEERKREFFTEWGHRFFDLKRWHRIDQVLSPIKPLWTSHAALLPIPATELSKNPALHQNPGY